MPANFTKEEKEILIKKFYKEGVQLLKKFGYKKLKITDIAVSVGIGTGTFYNFFKSKDEFVLWLIRQIKMNVWQQFLSLCNDYPDGIPIDEMEKFLYNSISHNNIYRCLTQNDYDLLQKKYSLLDDRTDKIAENGKFIMSKLATTQSVDRFMLFSEAYTIIVIGTSDLNKLNANYSDSAIKSLIHSACKLLY